MRKTYDTGNNGFTLVELLVAMALTLIVSNAVFSAYHYQQKTQLAQKQVVQMQQSVRMALYVITNELRMVGYDPKGTFTAGIIHAGDGSNGDPLTFTFVADDDGDDNDNDGETDESGELKTIGYDLYVGLSDGDTDIGRKVGAGNRMPLAENIKDLEFKYYDKNGVQIVTPCGDDLSDIRSIGVEIEATLDKNEKNHANVNNRKLTTRVKCRNLGLQL